MNWTIREAHGDDRAAVIAIQRRAGKAELKTLPHLATTEVPDLSAGLDALRPKMLIAEVNGGQVGFVAFTGSEIHWLYVDPPFAGRGIGRALFRAAVDRCGSTAWLRMLAANKAAMNLYLTEGFAIVHRALISVPGLEEPIESVEMRLRPSPA